MPWSSRGFSLMTRRLWCVGSILPLAAGSLSCRGMVSDCCFFSPVSSASSMEAALSCLMGLGPSAVCDSWLLRLQKGVQDLLVPRWMQPDSGCLCEHTHAKLEGSSRHMLSINGATYKQAFYSQPRHPVELCTDRAAGGGLSHSGTCTLPPHEQACAPGGHTPWSADDLHVVGLCSWRAGGSCGQCRRRDGCYTVLQLRLVG